MAKKKKYDKVVIGGGIVALVGAYLIYKNSKTAPAAVAGMGDIKNGHLISHLKISDVKAFAEWTKFAQGNPVLANPVVPMELDTKDWTNATTTFHVKMIDTVKNKKGFSQPFNKADFPIFSAAVQAEVDKWVIANKALKPGIGGHLKNAYESFACTFLNKCGTELVLVPAIPVANGKVITGTGPNVSVYTPPVPVSAPAL